MKKLKVKERTRTIKEVEFCSTDGQKFVERYNRNGNLIYKNDNRFGRMIVEYFGGDEPIHFKGSNLSPRIATSPNVDEWDRKEVKDWLEYLKPYKKKVIKRKHDKYGNVVRCTFSNGNYMQFKYTYNSKGYCKVEKISRWREEGVEDETLIYNPDGLLIMVINDYPGWKKFEYNNNGDVVHCIQAGGRQWWKKYKYHQPCNGKKEV